MQYGSKVLALLLSASALAFVVCGLYLQSTRPYKTRPELMAEMITLVAAWFPDRKFILVVDSLYRGKSVLSKLPNNFDLIGPVHPKAALYHPAPAETGVRHRPHRKKGERLPSAKSWEQDSSN